MKKFTQIALVASFAALAGCGLPGTFYAEPFIEESISGESFNQQLAKAYQERAKNSAEFDVNWILSGMYAKKGYAAMNGETVLPWDPNTYYEPATSYDGVPADRASKYNLGQKREQLMAALDNGGRERNPHACVQAQAHYDWLVDETYQDTPPAAADEEDKIQTDFQNWLNQCIGVQKVEPVAANQWVIYFGWDRHDLTADAMSVVNSITATVASMAGSSLGVVGHTDTSGADAYNNQLSNKRANVVVNAIRNQGANVNMMAEGRGEHDLAKPTADGVKEPLNRRTVIELKK